MWSDRKVRLENCIAQKNSVMLSERWEEQYTDFEALVEMPKYYNWQRNQLNSEPYGLDAKINQENESNEGGTV
jgi:hypothetical protein